MFESGRNKEAERFYLLPGMGGRAARRKHKLLLLWAIVVGVFISGAFATALYFTERVWR